MSDFVTAADLVADLRELGLAPGRTVMVHSSLRSFGTVLGGAPTVVRALIDALGPEGTLVMPAFSPEVSDPAGGSAASIAPSQRERARANVPAFDADTTPTSMGAIAETFRRWPGTLRGPHPQVSVCARGLLAADIVAPHAIDWAEAAGTPFERLTTMDADLLLLGVGFNRATVLHYAESLVPHRREKVRRIPLGEGTARRWVDAPDVGDDLNTHFPAIGAAFLDAGHARIGKVGAASTVLVSIGTLVPFASAYLDASARSAADRSTGNRCNRSRAVSVE